MKRTLCVLVVLALAGSLQAGRTSSPGGLLVVATDTGTVAVFDKCDPKQPISTFFPFDGYRGGVNVAAGDVTGDGIEDIIVAAGAGSASGTQFTLFSADGKPVRSVTPYAGFSGGVRVAVGDVNGDGTLDIITGPGPGGGPHVRVFSGSTGAPIVTFDTGFTGGVFVAAGDVNNDGRADIIVGAGAGGGPHVRVFDGRSGDLLGSFFAYDPGFLGGVRVAVGDVNGDGIPDIITGPGAGSGPNAVGPLVKVFDGRTSAELASFFVFDEGFRGGIHVAADSEDGGTVFATPGAASGGIATVRIFKAGANTQWLMPFAGYKGGLTVAASAGAMGKAPTRPNMTGGLKIDKTW